MQKFPWFPRAKNKNDLIAWLIVLGLVTLLGSVAAQAPSPWLSDFLLSLGASFLTFVVAVVLVDEVVRNHERNLAQAERAAQQRLEDERWRPVSHHVGFYVENVANKCALAYRIAIGIGDDQIPRDKLSPHVSEIDSLRTMASWIDDGIIPALPNLGRLDRAGWEELMTNLNEADTDATNVLLLFGNRLKPDIYQELLEIKRGINRVLQAYELFGSVLGGPHDPVTVRPDMHIFDAYKIGLKHGKSAQELIQTLRKLEIKDAAERGAYVLKSAVRLLEATIPLLPTDNRSGRHQVIVNRNIKGQRTIIQETQT
jgi:hypothetical protein